MPGRCSNTEDCFWLLGSLCNFYRIPFDAALVASQFPPPYNLATFHEAARALGFKTGFQALPRDGWDKLPYPCIAFLKASAPNQTRATETPPGDHQVIAFPTHPQKLPAQAESFAPSPSTGEGRREGGESSDRGETPTPILIVKTDGQQLLYFRPNAQTPES